MTDQARAEAERVHGNTKKAADTALAKRAISRESHRAVHEGRVTLAEAHELGRDGSPYGPAVRADKNDRSRLCLCGCQEYTRGGRFVPGHDTKMFRVAREHLTEGRELTHDQSEHLETSGKMGRVRPGSPRRSASAGSGPRRRPRSSRGDTGPPAACRRYCD